MSAVSSGEVTSSNGGLLLTFTDTGTGYGTIVSRTLSFYNFNMVLISTFNMGTNLSQAVTISADGYYIFVLAVVDNTGPITPATVKYLAQQIYITDFVNVIVQLGCGCNCDSEELTYSDISDSYAMSANTTAIFGLGSATQSLITAANTIISGQ